MKTWYFKIEGKGKNSQERFGYFVHCLVSTNTKQKARSLVFKELAKDELTINNILFNDEFNKFAWDNQELENDLLKLANYAKVNKEEVFFSPFYIWTI